MLFLSSLTILVFLRQNLLAIAGMLKLGGQWIAEFLLFPSPHHWVYTDVPNTICCFASCGFWNLMFASQTAYQLSHFLRTITDIFIDDYLVREIVHANQDDTIKSHPYGLFLSRFSKSCWRHYLNKDQEWLLTLNYHSFGQISSLNI